MEQLYAAINSNNQQYKSQSTLFITQKILLEPSAVDKNKTLTIDVIRIKTKFEQMALNPNNIEDRALSLSIKMMQQQKARQQKQKKMIDEIRLHQLSKSFQIGQISRMIVNQQYIGKHQYLRQNLYKNDHYRIKISHHNPQNDNKNKSQKKKIIKRQIEILQKYKLLSKKSENKKLIKDIFYDLIDKTVELIQKKKSFVKYSPRKINLSLKNQLKSKNYKAQLSMSRVMDITIRNEGQKIESEDQQSEDQQNESIQNEDQSNEQQQNKECSQVESCEQNDDNQENSDGKDRQKQQQQSQIKENEKSQDINSDYQS